MKFTFKELPHQKQAAESIISVFEGLQFLHGTRYNVDLGKEIYKRGRIVGGASGFAGFDIGTANANIDLENDEIAKAILDNIQKTQKSNGLDQSKTLKKQLGVLGLDIEMETGTGKTYVYIDSIFRLNKEFAFTKFVIVVPSVAIQEGVKSSFKAMAEHFHDKYGKTIKPIIFDAEKLNSLSRFSSSQGIEVIIINTSQFNKNSNVIYKSDDARFGARVPMNFIAKNRPIIILDEPQKMGVESEETEEKSKNNKKSDNLGIQAGLKRFNPLFFLNFSATHKPDSQHNMMYVLDSIDAYREKLVKRIEVVSIDLENLTGSDAYIYFKKYDHKSGKAFIELDIRQKGADSIKRTAVTVEKLDDLYEKSKGRSDRGIEPYRGYSISEIVPIVQDKKVVSAIVHFANGVKIKQGQIINNQAEEGIRRAQIRETIKAHLLRERSNFNNGIKTLSLFFISRIAQYRQFGADGGEIVGVYQRLFIEEYSKLVAKELEDPNIKGTAYAKYLIRLQDERVHNGYFCEKKVSGKTTEIDVEVNEKGEATKKENDESLKEAYDLILRKKEDLLSFKTPLRFLFSVAALREGWDNPNVFQICTLTESGNDIKRKQEVGRGMRLCVNESGVRMDALELEEKIHAVNVLTIIPSESYETFVKGLQNEFKAELHNRPMAVKVEYLVGKELINASGIKLQINKEIANKIIATLAYHDYIDSNGFIMESYETAKSTKTLEPFKAPLSEYADSIHEWIGKIVTDKQFSGMIKKVMPKEDTITVKVNKANLEKKEFMELWNRIKQRFTYRVKFDSNKLVEKAIKEINDKDNGLHYVRQLRYVIDKGVQDEMTEKTLVDQTTFIKSEGDRDIIDIGQVQAYYDVLGEIEKGTGLTRRTIATILKGVGERWIQLFKQNPEDCLKRLIYIINLAKLEFEVAAINYLKVESGNDLEDTFSINMFAAESVVADKESIVPTEKRNVMNYAFTDSSTIEKPFVIDLDKNEKVSVYAKLPTGKGGYKIPTPLGNYTPDWAIAFEKDKVKHIYFVAETKGVKNENDLPSEQKNRVKCARKLYEELLDESFKYEIVTNVKDLFDEAELIK